MSEEISWNRNKGDVISSGPHRDYPLNLENARKFCKRVDPVLLKGMKVYVCGSHALSDSLVMVCWKPPKEHHAGNYATPIFLHDSTSNVNKRIEGVFNTYMRKAKEWFDKFPPQPDLPGFKGSIFDRLV